MKLFCNLILANNNLVKLLKSKVSKNFFIKNNVKLNPEHISSFSLLLITLTPPKKKGNFNNLFSYFPAKELPTAFPDLGLTYFKFFLSP